MVNTVYRVLEALRQADTVSGQGLSRRLGISRVAVWKHVQELRQQGYSIQSSSSGYRLLSVPDALLPGEFPGWERRIHHFDEVDSTMRIARELARSGAEEGTLIVAERQTHGRGRLNRTWLSPTGGIYLTVVTRPRIAAALAPRVNLIASVSVAATLQMSPGVPARVKWPNDVLVHGRKVCGILSEMEAESDVVGYVNIGIGLNVNAPVDRDVPDAVSLAEAAGRPVSRTEIVRSLVADLLQRLPGLASPGALRAWRELSETIGREVCIAQGQEMVRGTAVDIEETGALVIQTPDGGRQTVFAGDCTYPGS